MLDNFQQYKFHDTFVNYWFIDLNKQSYNFISILTQAELERANKFKYKKDQERFIITRGYLKKIISQYLNIDIHELNFSYNKHGKPFLNTDNLSFRKVPIYFNVAHSADHALIAINDKYDIGVDLEIIKPVADPENIIKRFFSATEHEQFSKISDESRLDYFFTLWACKEAFVKALGAGIFCHLNSFGFNLNSLHPANSKPQVALLCNTNKEYINKNWHIIHFAPTHNYQAAIALNLYL